jgi:hypothetical protein
LCNIHHDGTTAWVIHGHTFREWTATGSLLWVHGKRAFLLVLTPLSPLMDNLSLTSGLWEECTLVRANVSSVPYGVPILVTSSTIIEDIEGMCDAGLASLAYFYFDVRDSAKQDIRGLLTSLLCQLSARSDLCCKILSTLYYDHDSGSRQPNDDALTQCLKDMLTIPGRGPIYIVVDAVDECPNIPGTPSPRENVLGLLDELVQLKHPDLHICAISRPEPDIETILRPLSSLSMSLHDKTGKIQDDIFDYVNAVVNSDQSMQKWTAEDRRLVIDTLSERADGMYVIVFV